MYELIIFLQARTNKSSDGVEIWEFHEHPGLYFYSRGSLPFLASEPDPRYSYNFFLEDQLFKKTWFDLSSASFLGYCLFWVSPI